MDKNLELQYDEIVRYIGEYEKFAHSFIDRIGSKRSLFPVRWRNDLIDPFKLPDSIKKSALDVATEDEKKNEFFETMISDYPIDKFSTNLGSRFNDVDFEKVNKLHDMKKAGLSFSDKKHIAAIILAVIGGLLQLIPKRFVEETFSINTEYIEFLLFLIIIILFAYLLSVLMPRLIARIGLKKSHQRMAYILEYTWIKKQ